MVVDLFKRRRGIWIYRVGDKDNPAFADSLHRVLRLIEEGKRPSCLITTMFGPFGFFKQSEIPIFKEFIAFGNEPGIMFVEIDHPSRPAVDEDLEFVKEQLQTINQKIRRCIVGYSSMICKWVPMRKMTNPIITSEGEIETRPITGFCLSLVGKP